MNTIQQFEMWLDEMDNRLEVANKAGVPLIVEEMGLKSNTKADKYPNGYKEKIGYWQYKLNKAIESGNVGGVKYATQRLNYFMNRQYQRA